QEKGVEPRAKVEPEVGLQIGVCKPGQLSDAVGLKETTAPLGDVHSATGAGQEIAGSCLSTTVTFALQDAESCSVPVTVKVTWGGAKAYGAAGICVRVRASPSGSDEPSLTDTDAAEQSPGSVDTVTSVHFATGVTAFPTTSTSHVASER